MRIEIIVFTTLLVTAIFLLGNPIVVPLDNSDTVSALTSAETSAAGRLDHSFGGFGGHDGKIETPGMSTRDIVLQPDNKIVVSGKSGADLIVRRYEANGQVDAGFGSGGEFRITLGTGSPCNVEYSCGLALQPDGKILVAADSDMSGDEDFALVRLTHDGQPDSSFGAGGLVLTDFDGLSDTANDLAVQADGKIVVVGRATLHQVLHDDWVWGVARFLPDGRPDHSFSKNGRLTTRFDENLIGSSWQHAHAIAIQPDGKIVVTGYVKDMGSHGTQNGNYFGFARYDQDGTLDKGFGDGGKKRVNFSGSGDSDAAANDLALYPNGTIVAVGHMALDLDTKYKHAFVQLDKTGNRDLNFDKDGKQTVDIDDGEGFETLMAVELQPGGKIVATGYSAEGRIVLTRLDNGQPDPTFAFDGTLDWYNGFGRDMAIQPDGKILVLYDSGIMRFMPDGSLDKHGRTITDFGNGSDKAWAATVQADGKIILAGESVPPNSSRKYMALARFNPDGTLDKSFDGNGRSTATFISGDSANDVVVDTDGSIIAAGFTDRYTDIDFAVYRFDADGDLDEANNMHHVDFGYGDDFAQEVLVQPDGKIVVAGNADYPIAANPDRVAFALARLHPDGTLDETFGEQGKVLTVIGINSSARLRAALLDDEGRIVVVGSYQSEIVIGRYTADGQLDPTFRGGGFYIYREIPVNGGPALDHPFDTAYSVGLLPGGNIAVGGEADNDYGLLIVGPDGGRCTICGHVSNPNYYWLPVEVGSSIPDMSYDMAVQPDGKIILVGNELNSPTAFFIVRLKPKHPAIGGYELDSSFGYNGKASVPIMSSQETARAVALFESRIIVAGNSYNYHDHDFSVAVWENDVFVQPPPEPESPTNPTPDPDSEENKVFLPLVIR